LTHFKPYYKIDEEPVFRSFWPLYIVRATSSTSRVLEYSIKSSTVFYSSSKKLDLHSPTPKFQRSVTRTLTMPKSEPVCSSEQTKAIYPHCG